MYFTTEGILGIPLGVSATFIFLFILFGAFLEKTGIGKLFIDIADAIAGWAAGGPAKVAVITSALEGTVSGSSVGNTVGSGSFTIPMMKKLGYRPEFAGAVEAAASTGGQIMPPVMGAAAFLMSEFINVPYIEIAKAAAIPACLYFLGIFIEVHFEAKRGAQRRFAPWAEPVRPQQAPVGDGVRRHAGQQRIEVRGHDRAEWDAEQVLEPLLHRWRQPVRPQRVPQQQPAALLPQRVEQQLGRHFELAVRAVLRLLGPEQLVQGRPVGGEFLGRQGSGHPADEFRPGRQARGGGKARPDEGDAVTSADVLEQPRVNFGRHRHHFGMYLNANHLH
jgi:hypothetical protein